MRYFQNALFPVSLGKSLGFSEETISVATAIPGKIFCEDFDMETNVNKSFEVSFVKFLKFFLLNIIIFRSFQQSLFRFRTIKPSSSFIGKIGPRFSILKQAGSIGGQPTDLVVWLKKFEIWALSWCPRVMPKRRAWIRMRVSIVVKCYFLFIGWDTWVISHKYNWSGNAANETPLGRTTLWTQFIFVDVSGCLRHKNDSH